MPVIVEPNKLPGVTTRMFGLGDEKEAARYAARFGELLYYCPKSWTYYVIDHGR